MVVGRVLVGEWSRERIVRSAVLISPSLFNVEPRPRSDDRHRRVPLLGRHVDAEDHPRQRRARGAERLRSVKTTALNQSRDSVW